MNWLGKIRYFLWQKSERRNLARLTMPGYVKDVLSIQHAEHGLEQFVPRSARFNLDRCDDGITEFVLSVRASSLKRNAELEGMGGDPWFEVTVPLPTLSVAGLVIGKIQQAKGYDSQRGHLTNFYYFTHESVDDLVIDIIEVHDLAIEVKLAGTVLICGPQQDAKFSMHSTFTRDPQLRRGVS